MMLCNGNLGSNSANDNNCTPNTRYPVFGNPEKSDINWRAQFDSVTDEWMNFGCPEEFSKENEDDAFICRTWGKFGVDKICPMNNGIFVVRFKEYAGRERALNAGPVFFDKNPVIAKKWVPGLDLTEEKVEVIPVWVRLPGLDLRFWGQSTLMKIGSLVGKPLNMDRAIATKELIAYARLLVEVKIGTKLIENIEFMDENGCWVPKRSNLPAQTQKVWRPVRNDYKVQSQEVVDNNKVKRTEGCFSILSRIGDKEDGELFRSNGELYAQVTPSEKEWKTVGSESVFLFGLLETKVKTVKFGSVFANFGGDWAVSANYSKHPNGRIWVIWKPDLFYVDIVEVDAQFIHLKALHKGTGILFWYTVVYGFNNPGLREHLWDRISHISSCVNGPWIVGGDFNNVLNIEDRVGSAVSLSEVENFRLCVRNSSLLELKSSGMFYTWNNKQEGADRVCSKIDRVFGNYRWCSVFQHAHAEFLPEGLMDHSPCVVTFLENVGGGFARVVAEAWQYDGQGTAMFKLIQNLKRVKVRLKDINSQLRSHVEDEEAKNPRDESLIAGEGEARKRFSEAHNAKLKFLKQKAKAHWAREGDMNTAFFYACIRKRRMQNSVFSIQKKDGEVTNDPKEIADTFIDFYKGMLGTHSDAVWKLHQSVIVEGPVLSADQGSQLCRDFSVEDVKSALWSMDDNRAPGLDGFSSGFFKAAWNIVGEDLCNAVLDFFRHGRLLKQVNNTLLTLIPKVDNAT
ncbi:uncharacterized protein LOC110704583 [Chenopodium quinoa]|uniref:uncharacterized protein LOC110704583 n=1 Tax=Chenopodium quinoa TaxID=63459 RepID=UPI000B77B199|nr:uncharacterized protein LOC110704583 [Chenopodium quinoa]